MKTGKLDEYAVRARLFPAFLALIPVGICAAQFISFGSAIIAASSAFGGTALLSFVLSQWSRDAGKSKERQLYELWGGMPTTAYLRHRDTAVNATLKLRRHQRLQRMAPDLILPSVHAEANNTTKADEQYEAATKVLIQRTRDKEKYHVLFQELIEYGFRRNAWGLRNTALLTLLFSLFVTVFLSALHTHLVYNSISIGIFLLFAGWWFTVTPDWVHRAAKNYAERLFDALDEKVELDEVSASRIELA